MTMDKQPPVLSNEEIPSNCEIVKASAPKLPFDDGSFDWVVTFSGRAY